MKTFFQSLRTSPLKSLLLAATIIAFVLLNWAQPIQANGGTTMLTEQVGPYDLTVTASPYPLRVDQVNDISTLIGRQSDQQLVLEAEIILIAEPVDHSGEAQTFAATHDNATNKLYYAANVVFPTPGRWQITVQIDGPEGPATTTFEEQVEEKSSAAILIYPLIGVVVGAILFGVAVFIGRRSRAG